MGRAEPSRLAAGASPEAIVADKIARLAAQREGVARRMAADHHVELPPDVERFFAAAREGDWDKMSALYGQLAARRNAPDHGKEAWAGLDRLAAAERNALSAVWQSVHDTFGVAEQAHLWPAKQLLDYGDSVMSALKPGMVYVGGTDPGRWVPELMNETGDAEPRVVITQNALADTSYLEYARILYGDRISLPDEAASGKIFAEYSEDAQRRAEHDRDHPDEPPQLKPGEDIRIEPDGRTSVSGQVAVMAINERILQSILATNPDLSFGLQESFPLKGTYPDAVPLGPIMELRGDGGGAPLTAERGGEIVANWQGTLDRMRADPASMDSDETMKAYSHDANSQANLLAARGLASDAEKTYRLALDLYPGSTEALGSVVGLMAAAGRTDEAREWLDGLVAPTAEFKDRIDALRKTLGAAKP